MSTTLERLELLEFRVNELEHEVLQLRAIVAWMKRQGVETDGLQREPLRDAETLFNQHYAKRKPLLS